MKRRSALHAAREQIVWILALIGSTAVVIHLERLDLQQASSALTQNPFGPARPEFAALLAEIRAQEGDSDRELAQRATALTMVVLLDDTPPELLAEARATLAEIEARVGTGADDLLRPAAALLAVALDLLEEG